MAGPYCYAHPRPAVTVDAVVFCVRRGVLNVLLVRRKKDPFAGQWALPGGFLEIEEPVADAALRELEEETGLRRLSLLAPLSAYGAPGRDPRGRTISLAHIGLVRPPIPRIRGGDDAADATWHAVTEVGGLAFDHDFILDEALDWLDREVDQGEAAIALLPKTFSDQDATMLFRALSATAKDAVAWRLRLLRIGRIAPVGGRVRKFRAVEEWTAE
jgi:8-oxo-dGTP diphosphatase